MSFNPFDIPIGEPLDEALLQSLITNKVAEGFYVEYKRELPPENKKRKIGQSIASFANTYGGWYIVGVTTNTHNVATNIDGFSLDQVSDPISKVRDIIKSHVDPLPLFFQQVVELSNGNVVLVVYVPNNQDTPFITSNGKIYRRESDSSEPVPENNRYALDRLVDSGKRDLQFFERFCQDERVFSQEEDDLRWINLYFYPYPKNIIKVFNTPNEDTLKSLLDLSRQSIPINKDNDRITLNTPFEVGKITNSSVILRQKPYSLTASNSATIEFFWNGAAKIFIPVPDQNLNINDLKSDIVKQAILTYKGSNLYFDDLRFIDIGTLYAVIIGMTNYYMEWLKEQTLLTSLKLGMELNGFWRTVSFYDFDKWGEYVLHFGLPVIQRNYIKIPDSWQLVKPINITKDMSLWGVTTARAGNELGIPIELVSDILIEFISREYKVITS